MLYVVDHAINAQWSKVEHLIEQEETSEAKKICRNWVQIIKEQFDIAFNPPKDLERFLTCRILESDCIENYTLFNLLRILFRDFE